jgi:hypothetical protein
MWLNSGSCPVEGFTVCDTEPQRSVTRELINLESDYLSVSTFSVHKGRGGVVIICGQQISA